MNFVLDPYVMHLDDESWENEDLRDQFIEYFLQCLNLIDTCRDSMIYWSEALETLVWENPTSPPWRGYIDMKHQLVPIVYRKFPSSQRWIDIDCQYEICEFSPRLVEAGRYEKAFKTLCGTLVSHDENFSLILGKNQEIPERSEFALSCSPPLHEKLLHGENTLSKWLENVEFVNYIWPENVHDLEDFEQIINLCTASDDNIYKIRFTEEFIRSVLNLEIRYKLALTKAMIQRLTMTRDQAATSSLQEEVVHGENRIRITPRPTSTRAHFTFEKKNIIFQRFYRVGEHDDAL